MTKFGFYSVVKKTGGYHIRARERGDLEVLTAAGGPLAGELIYTGRSDYHYRVVVNQATFSRFMEYLTTSLDYPNFKAKIDQTPSQGRKPYHRIWRLLCDTLGAYGMAPTIANLGTQLVLMGPAVFGDPEQLPLGSSEWMGEEGGGV